MFLAATSQDNRDKTKTQDFASVFTTNLQEGFQIQNFQIELVSAIITTEKNIKINTTNNRFVVRVGEDTTCEQYTISVPINTYSPNEFADVIVDAILNVIPIQGWVRNSAGAKSFSCIYDTSGGTPILKLTFTKLAQNDNNIAEFVNDTTAENFGYDSVITEGGAAGDQTRRVIKFVFPSEAEKNNQPLESQTANTDLDALESGSITGLDVMEGVNVKDTNNARDITLLQRHLTYTGFDECGIAEQDGIYEVDLRPSRCSINTNYNFILGSGDTNKAPYFVIDDETQGTQYDSRTWNHSLLNHQSGTIVREDADNKRYVSGILLHQTPGSNDSRGTPYRLPRGQLCFPPNEYGGHDGAGILTTNAYRREKISSTWNNSFRMSRAVGPLAITGQEVSSYNYFQNRGFNLVINDDDPDNITNPDSKAVSSLALFRPNTDGVLDEKEKLTFRLANAPLIQGLLQYSDTGTITQSYIKANNAVPPISPAPPANEGIMTTQAPSGGVIIKYKLNVVGQCNSLNFGAGAVDNTNNSGGVNRRLPYYKIVKLDSNDQPELVVLCDGGEGIIAGEKLVLNDSRTFDVVSNTTPISQQDIVDGFLATIVPLASNIGACDPLYTTRFQYLPTTISLCNDLIYNGIVSNKQLSVADNKRAISSDFAKDIQISLIPLNSTKSNQNESVRFQIKGFLPTDSDYADEEEMANAFANNPQETSGMEQLFFEGVPASWNSLTYTPARGSGLVNWTNFVQNDAASRIKLKIKLKNYFEYELIVSHLNTGTGAYEGENVLLSTFEACASYPELKCFPKSRLYPLHIGISSTPNTGFDNLAAQGDNKIKIENTTLARYIKKINPETQQKIDSYYRANLANITALSEMPGIFEYPADATAIGGTDLARPPIMIKFGNAYEEDNTPISGTTPVVNKLPTLDLAPLNNQYIASATGFHSSYIVNTGSYGAGTSITFDAAQNVNDFTSLGTFAVEIDSLPIKGYITEAYDTDTNTQVGNGGCLPIVAVVPFLEQRNPTQQETYVTLRYSSPYSQPVLVELPTPTYLYNFSFRLRNIETNKYLKNLLNPTELIFRLDNLDKKKI